MEKFLVEVSAEHIANGKPRNCRACPIALALEEHGFCGVRVQKFLINFFSGDKRYSAYVPQEAYDFMDAFDFGYFNMKPFSFELSPREIPLGAK